jgi:hypothetical protein
MDSPCALPSSSEREEEKRTWKGLVDFRKGLDEQESQLVPEMAAPRCNTSSMLSIMILWTS